jgi:hypothetical protein
MMPMITNIMITCMVQGRFTSMVMMTPLPLQSFR